MAKSRTRSPFACVVVLLGALAPLVCARPAAAQAPPQGWCVPGTPLCVQGAGQGNGNGRGGAGVTLGGSASGQVGPNGAQGQAQGNANANANGNVQGQAQGNGDAHGNVQGQGGGDSGDEEPHSSGGRVVRRRSVRTGPPLAVGYSPCLVGRIGVWSGVHGGACFGFGLRSYEGVGFELDFVMLGGGELPTLDLLLRPTLVVPLAGTTPYFDQLSLKIGSTIVGGSIPLEGSKGYVRFGGSIGLGYDMSLSNSVDWRLLDASFYGEVRVGSRSAAYMDHEGHSWDIGLMLSTGLFFY